ncbi:unnamed protein product [Lampetra fluviatilis]
MPGLMPGTTPTLQPQPQQQREHRERQQQQLQDQQQQQLQDQQQQQPQQQQQQQRLFLRYPLVELALAGGGALLFCGFVVWDTQRLLQRLSPEDYVEGAVSLYLDLINLFLYILRLLEAVRRK